MPDSGEALTNLMVNGWNNPNYRGVQTVTTSGLPTPTSLDMAEWGDELNYDTLMGVVELLFATRDELGKSAYREVLIKAVSGIGLNVKALRWRQAAILAHIDANRLWAGMSTESGKPYEGFRHFCEDQKVHLGVNPDYARTMVEVWRFYVESQPVPSQFNWLDGFNGLGIRQGWEFTELMNASMKRLGAARKLLAKEKASVEDVLNMANSGRHSDEHWLTWFRQMEQGLTDSDMLLKPPAHWAVLEMDDSVMEHIWQQLQQANLQAGDKFRLMVVKTTPQGEV